MRPGRMIAPALPRGWPLGLLALALAVGAALWLLDPAALWVQLMGWIVAVQRELHQALATALREVQARGAVAGAGLVALSFLYGVFHAAGPGHGKVVITTYLLTQKESLGRGIALAVTASLVQGLVAIAAVLVTVGLLEQTARQSQLVAGRIETLSFVLLAGLGLFLAWRHGRRLWLAWRSSRRLWLARRPSRRIWLAWRPSRRLWLAWQPSRRLWLARRPGRPVAGLAACGCGDPHHHHHAPPPDRAFLAGLFSIGLRPCSGAILVLILAIALDLRLAGILAVLAMATGTALTVAGLATLAVLARDRARRLGHRLDQSGTALARTADLVALAGGLLLATLALSLLHAQLTLPTHPLL
jgi:nickel/cobalt transporter (NicO) family protein